MVLILAFYNSATIPLEISFKFVWQQTLVYTILDHFIDFVFLVDMYVNFKTSFLTERGLEEFDSHQIAMHYTTGLPFAFDCLSLLGAGVINPNNNLFLKLCGFGKLIRIKRLGRFIDSLNMRVSVKSFVTICKIIIYIVLYLHIATCSWVFCVDFD